MAVVWGSKELADRTKIVDKKRVAFTVAEQVDAKLRTLVGRVVSKENGGSASASVNANGNQLKITVKKTKAGKMFGIVKIENEVAAKVEVISEYHFEKAVTLIESYII